MTFGPAAPNSRQNRLVWLCDLFLSRFRVDTEIIRAFAPAHIETFRSCVTAYYLLIHVDIEIPLSWARSISRE